MSAANAGRSEERRASADRFASSRSAQVAAVVWGIAEATVFFIVPDVLLMWIASRSLRAGLKATAATTIGALIGGALMYGVGERSPREAEAFLERIPAISSTMIDGVRRETADYGLAGVLFGPLQGQPYKIYAVEWGSRHGNLPAFVLMSIPARAVRFVLCVLVAHLVMRALARWTKRNASVEATILVVGWTAFYAFYFAHFGG